MKTKIQQQEKLLQKQDQILGKLQNQNQDQVPTTYRKSVNFEKNMMSKLKDFNKVIIQKDEEIEKLKRNIKLTKTNEMEVEYQILMQESKRLKKILTENFKKLEEKSVTEVQDQNNEINESKTKEQGDNSKRHITKAQNKIIQLKEKINQLESQIKNLSNQNQFNQELSKQIVPKNQQSEAQEQQNKPQESNLEQIVQQQKNQIKNLEQKINRQKQKLEDLKTQKSLFVSQVETLSEEKKELQLQIEELTSQKSLISQTSEKTKKRLEDQVEKLQQQVAKIQLQVEETKSNIPVKVNKDTQTQLKVYNEEEILRIRTEKEALQEENDQDKLSLQTQYLKIQNLEDFLQQSKDKEEELLQQIEQTQQVINQQHEIIKLYKEKDLEMKKQKNKEQEQKDNQKENPFPNNQQAVIGSDSLNKKKSSFQASNQKLQNSENKKETEEKPQEINQIYNQQKSQFDQDQKFVQEQNSQNQQQDKGYLESQNLKNLNKESKKDNNFGLQEEKNEQQTIQEQLMIQKQKKNEKDQIQSPGIMQQQQVLTNEIKVETSKQQNKDQTAQEQKILQQMQENLSDQVESPNQKKGKTEQQTEIKTEKQIEQNSPSNIKEQYITQQKLENPTQNNKQEEEKSNQNLNDEEKSYEKSFEIEEQIQEDYLQAQQIKDLEEQQNKDQESSFKEKELNEGMDQSQVYSEEKFQKSFEQQEHEQFHENNKEEQENRKVINQELEIQVEESLEKEDNQQLKNQLQDQNQLSIDQQKNEEQSEKELIAQVKQSKIYEQQKFPFDETFQILSQQFTECNKKHPQIQNAGQWFQKIIKKICKKNEHMRTLNLNDFVDSNDFILLNNQTFKLQENQIQQLFSSLCQLEDCLSIKIFVSFIDMYTDISKQEEQSKVKYMPFKQFVSQNKKSFEMLSSIGQNYKENNQIYNIFVNEESSYSNLQITLKQFFKYFKKLGHDKQTCQKLYKKMLLGNHEDKLLIYNLEAILESYLSQESIIQLILENNSLETCLLELDVPQIYGFCYRMIEQVSQLQVQDDIPIEMFRKILTQIKTRNNGWNQANILFYGLQYEGNISLCKFCTYADIVRYDEDNGFNLNGESKKFPLTNQQCSQELEKALEIIAQIIDEESINTIQYFQAIGIKPNDQFDIHQFEEKLSIEIEIIEQSVINELFLALQNHQGTVIMYHFFTCIDERRTQIVEYDQDQRNDYVTNEGYTQEEINGLNNQSSSQEEQMNMRKIKQLQMDQLEDSDNQSIDIQKEMIYQQQTDISQEMIDFLQNIVHQQGQSAKTFWKNTLKLAKEVAWKEFRKALQEQEINFSQEQFVYLMLIMNPKQKDSCERKMFVKLLEEDLVESKQSFQQMKSQRDNEYSQRSQNESLDNSQYDNQQNQNNSRNISKSLSCRSSPKSISPNESQQNLQQSVDYKKNYEYLYDQNSKSDIEITEQDRNMIFIQLVQQISKELKRQNRSAQEIFEDKMNTFQFLVCIEKLGFDSLTEIEFTILFKTLATEANESIVPRENILKALQTFGEDQKQKKNNLELSHVSAFASFQNTLKFEQLQDYQNQDQKNDQEKMQQSQHQMINEEFNESQKSSQKEKAEEQSQNYFQESLEYSSGAENFEKNSDDF